MKLLRVGGLVLAFHVIGFFLIFLNPGCRSTARQEPRTATPQPESASTATPVPAATVEPVAGPALAPSPYGGAGEEGGLRAAPTRPTAEQLGLPPPPAPDLEYTVKSGDSLWKIASKHGLPVDTLLKANSLKRGSALQVGQKLRIPGKGQPGQSAPAAPSTEAAPAAGDGAAPREAGTLPYQVRMGDSLTLIARRHNTTVAAIKAVNRMRNDRISAGQVLQIPVGQREVPGSAAYVAEKPAPRAAAPRTPAPAPAVRTHEVQEGETLSSIARRYGVSEDDIIRASGLTNVRGVRPGQMLKVPAAASTPAAPAPEAGGLPPAVSIPMPTIPGAASPAPAAPAPAAAEPQPNADAVPVVPVEEGR